MRGRRSSCALAGDGPVRIVLGVTGQQGFLLGRGNQQIAPELIARAGREGLIVLASEPKLAALAAAEAVGRHGRSGARCRGFRASSGCAPGAGGRR